jgi:glycosyltransferase involved in cell wall biosynthesis
MSTPRVISWSNIPSPYVVEWYNTLAERKNIGFQAWFNGRREPDRSWNVDESNWAFRHQYVPLVRTMGSEFRLPAPAFSRPKPDVLVSLYAEPTFLAGWRIAKQRGVRTAFWVESTFDAWVPRREWKERLKQSVFRRADAAFTPGQDGVGYAVRYGVPADRCFPLPFFANAKYFREESRRAAQGRDALRAKLGLRGITFLYVGRLWWGKGVRYLLDAFAGLQRSVDFDVSLLLLGDGEEEALLRARSRELRLRNVCFAGFQQRTELPRYYAASDIFVFPTLGDTYGQVVGEAMASGLPVISSTSAGEIRQRIVEGTNGFLVPPKDSAALQLHMKQLARDPELRQRMSDAASKAVQDVSLAQWAEAFEDAVSRVLAMPRRAGGAS